MNVGPLLIEDGDLEAIERMHRESAFDYKLPSFRNNPLFPIQRSIRDKGNFVAAVLVKVEAETYLFLDHRVRNPKFRYQALKTLHEDLISEARNMGFDCLHAYLPPQVARSFGPRLEKVGWRLDRDWPSYSFVL